MLTIERLRHALDYDSETGVFTWRIAGRGRKNEIGDVAGTVGPAGYVRIGLDTRRYYAHRLVWFHVHGHLPAGEVDHINGDRADNRLVNLRDVPKLHNHQNIRRPTSVNKLGVLGVRQTLSGFSASIGHLKRHTHLGTFKTPEAAHAAYVAAKREFHEGCTL